MTVWYLTTGGGGEAGKILHGFIFPKPCVRGLGSKGYHRRAWKHGVASADCFGFEGNQNVFNQKAHLFVPRDWGLGSFQLKQPRPLIHTNSTQVDSSYGNGKVFTYYSSTWRHNIKKCKKVCMAWRRLPPRWATKERESQSERWLGLNSLSFFEFLLTGHSLSSIQHGRGHIPILGNVNGWNEKAVKKT